MASFEPVDIDRDGMGEGYDKWDDDVIKDLEIRFNKLREFNETLNESTGKDTIDMTEKTKNAFKHDTIELAANQIYDRLTIFLNNDRKKFDIRKGEPIIDPIREYRNFKLSDDGELTYIYKGMVINLGNINNKLKASWEIRKLGVSKLKLMSFTNITYEDINPYDQRFKEQERRL